MRMPAPVLQVGAVWREPAGNRLHGPCQYGASTQQLGVGLPPLPLPLLLTVLLLPLVLPRAVADGVRLTHFFAWSFTDNWEWREGFGTRFGLVSIGSLAVRSLNNPLSCILQHRVQPLAAAAPGAKCCCKSAVRKTAGCGRAWSLTLAEAPLP